MSIELAESYLTGDILIDNEHRKMIEVLSRVSDLSKQGEIAKCKSTLAAFVKVSERHFDREERIFKQTDYPKRNEHATLHENLLSRAASILTKSRNETDMESFRENVEEMKDVLLEDIKNGDLEFVAFLEEKRRSEASGNG